MLFYLDQNRKILDNNFVISKEKALKIAERNPFAEWHEIEFSFTMGGYREGFEKNLYLEEDSTVRVEFTEIPPEVYNPITQLDRIEQAVNQSNATLSKTYSEIENEIIDKYTISLVENNII